MSAPDGPWRTWTGLPAGHALVALGSNLGDRRAHLDGALAALDAHRGVTVVARSTWHPTAPVGGPAGQGEFLNGAALVTCPLAPEALLELLHDVEHAHGRERAVVDGPRTLDLDLLLFGSERRDGPGLVLPHPRMAGRRFVLAPLAELCPELVLDGASVRARLAAMDAVPSR